MAGTKRPSGLYISRDGLTYTFNWKIGDENYSWGQQVQWRVNTGKWQPWWGIGVTASDTSAKVTLNQNLYWPKKNQFLFRIEFRVRGRKKDCSWSDWSSNGWNMTAPGSPSVSQQLDAELDNVCEFSWNYDASTTNNFPFTDVEWQSILVKECNVSDGSKLKWSSGVLGWQAGTGGKSGTKQITEDSGPLSLNSYARWFRCRTRGIGGNGGVKGCSYWRYTKHVYATPNKASITSWTSKAGTQASADVTVVNVRWFAVWSGLTRPIDKVEVQWAIGVPEAGLTCPRGLTWTTGATIRDGSWEDGATFSAEQDINFDECLFVRIATIHDRKVTYSDAALVRKWRLKQPSGLSAQTVESTHRATVTVTNNSELPDSKIAILYRSTNVEEFVIGIIPHGSSSVTVQCPDWTGEDAISFGAYAYQGDETEIERADGITAYAVTPNISSYTVWDEGAVPKAPTNVTAELSDTEGEVILTWDWTWSDADSAEISWSQNQNAWESTEEPETYEINNLHAAKWRVSGLQTGVVWYFRVRLIKTVEDAAVYGPYSEMASADLSSAPTPPMLQLSEDVIPQTGSVTASWEYISTDGTQQAYAEICTVTIDGETETYGDVIASTSGERHVVLSAQELGWETGQVYSLAVRVTSESSHISSWSEPVSVIIAEPVECEITETSFVERSRNLIPYPFYHTTRTVNGITFTDNGDGTVTVNGTNTGSSNAEFVLTATAEGVIVPAGKYILSGCDGGNSSTYLLQWNQPGSSIVNLYDGEKTFTLSADTIMRVSIKVVSGATVSDLTFRPMIRLASDGSSVWEAYNPIQTLTAMPLTLTVTGAGEGGTTSVVIERAKSYELDRPDESRFTGHDGETIVIYSQSGEGEIEIGRDDLVGTLDDGAPYRLIATTADSYGQTAEQVIEFTVNWEHQAVIPQASVTIDNANLIAMLMPIAPTGAAEGDTCDIYRLSSERPVKVIEGGAFGTEYVDPFPTIGDSGGYRFVLLTENGDYITEDNTFAWIDVEAGIDTDATIIDFGGDRVLLRYNMELSHSWEKDFTETTYLGGAIQGDWNLSVHRKTSMSADTVVTDDPVLIASMRRLAAYTGICHVRTVDGATFTADVQVSENRTYEKAGKIAGFDVQITQVDAERIDGMTYEEWEGAE